MPEPGPETVSLSGRIEIDALLTGFKWDRNDLNYGFPDSIFQYLSASVVYANNIPGFDGFNASQQESARQALRQYSDVSGLTFSEGGYETLRYAETAATFGAPAYGIPPLPRVALVGGTPVVGDMWFNNGQFNLPDGNDPQPGGFGAFTILHETGHALGLKHGHESGLFGDNIPEWLGSLVTDVNGPLLPADMDSHEFSVMTYRSEIGGPATLQDKAGNFPQSPHHLSV